MHDHTGHKLGVERQFLAGMGNDQLQTTVPSLDVLESADLMHFNRHTALLQRVFIVGLNFG